MASERMRGHFRPAQRKQYIFTAVLAALILTLVAGDVLAKGVPTEVRVGESVILTLPYQIKRYSVTVTEVGETAKKEEMKEPKGPALVQVISATPEKTELKIDGQYIGKATLIVWDKNDKKEFFDINVVMDTSDLEKRIAEIAPGDPVKITTLKNSVIVSGMVSSEDRRARIDSVLQSFGRDVKSRDLAFLQGGQTIQLDKTGTSDDKGIKFVNLLEVADTPQILLNVTVASIDRTAARELGINWAYAGRNVTIDTAVSSVTGGISKISNLVSGTHYGTLTTEGIQGANFALIHSPSGTQYLLKALADKGLAKVLAQPNLLVRNGETGRFLAGGEFPIPIVQSTGGGGGQNNLAVTVEFKEFGVKMNLTPVIKENGNIEIRMGNKGKEGCLGGVNEDDCQGVIISSLDNSNAVQLSGFRIPALKKDYVNSDVELRENETLVMAGIINDEWSKSLSKIPFLGDIPIIGAFFRDQQLNKAERELVFFITPHLVRPLPAGQTPAIPGANEPTAEQEKMMQWVPTLPDSMSLDPERVK